MWKELILELWDAAVFGGESSAGTVRSMESRVGNPFPSDLVELLSEADGVLGEFLVSVVWPVERIVEDNIDFRTRSDFAELYGSFDSLLFFGDNGGGDQFAFSVDPAVPGIYAWIHETDERRIVANDLRDYLTKVLISDGDEWYSEDQF
jgi:hypothetical protein